jgi:hypothetical protein
MRTEVRKIVDKIDLSLKNIEFVINHRTLTGSECNYWENKYMELSGILASILKKYKMPR